MTALWTEAKEATVDTAHRTVGCFHIGMQEDALTEHECTTRVGGVRTDRVVCIVGIKTTENDFSTVHAVIAVEITQKN